MTQIAKGIPEGFHTITPYLFINGATAAMKFYAKAFGAVPRLCMTKADGTVMHAEMKIGTSMIMLTDSQSSMPIHLFLYVEDVDSFIDHAVSAGAKLIAPPKTEWEGDRRGGVEDPYGITWWVGTQVAVMSREEMQERWASEQRS